MTEWRDVKGFEGLYKISETGEVYSIKRNKSIHKDIDKDGYYRVNLYNNGSKKHFRIHRLVAAAFLEKYSDDL